jgi:hypothetical protein
MPFAGALAGLSAVISPSVAAASSGTPGAASSAASPAPLAGGQYAGNLLLNDAGSELKSWNQTAPYCSPNPGFVANGTVSTDSGGDAKLTTTGKKGSCVALISPGSYSSGVIEADIDFPALPGQPGTVANWTGFWLTNGPAWPADGELDAVEVEPVDGENAVTWHSGKTSSLYSASTSGYVPNKLPAQSPNLTPGWHTVDIAYSKGFFAVYYDGDEYTSFTSSKIPGRPLNVYFTMSNTPDNSWVRERIGGPPINSDDSAATLTVKYLRIWSFR